MKIRITETKEIEKQTPFFTKEGNCYYAFYNDTHCLCVHDYESHPLIAVLNATSDYANYEAITAKEFEDAFQRVLDRLTDQFEQGRDIVTANSGLTTDSFQVSEEDRIN